MNRSAKFVVHQKTTVGDVIVAVMDTAMATVHDEGIAAEITSRVVANILAKASPGRAKQMVLACGAQHLH